MTQRKYKDSGIEWIGRIPWEWKTEKAKYIFSQRREKGNTDCTLLAATQKYGMYPQYLLEGVVLVANDTNIQQFKTVHINDYVISLRSFQGGFEISQYEGICSPAYQVFYACKPINNTYFKYLFKSGAFIQQINAYVLGIREGKNIQYEDFSTMFLPIPPLSEQQQIADYLDRKCGEIDALINLQEQMIAQLTDYKQSVITEAVTKGINPDAELVPSGIDWIGDVPKGWKPMRMKYIGEFQNGLTYSPHDVCGTEGILVLRSSNIQNAKITFDDNVYVKSAPASLMVKEGDIIICSRNGSASLIGKCAIVGEGVIASYGAFMVRFRSRIRNRFAFYLISTVIPQYKQLFTTTTINQLTKGMLSSMIGVLPPEDEQVPIASYLDSKCSEIDTLIELKRKKIDTLKEYKKSVIYEAVTGKTIID